MSYTPITINPQGNANPSPANISKSGNNDNGVTGVFFQVTPANPSKSFSISGLSGFLQNSDGTSVADPLTLSSGNSSANLVPKSSTTTGRTYTYTVSAGTGAAGPPDTGDAQIQVDP